MKIYSIFFALISSIAIADEYTSPLPNVEVTNSSSTMLSIHNLSSEQLDLEINGEVFSFPPSSGLKFACKGYKILELKINPNTGKNNPEFIDVPCQSRVVFNELYTSL